MDSTKGPTLLPTLAEQDGGPLEGVYVVYVEDGSLQQQGSDT